MNTEAPLNHVEYEPEHGCGHGCGQDFPCECPPSNVSNGGWARPRGARARALLLELADLGPARGDPRLVWEGLGGEAQARLAHGDLVLVVGPESRRVPGRGLAVVRRDLPGGAGLAWAPPAPRRGLAEDGRAWAAPPGPGVVLAVPGAEDPAGLYRGLLALGQAEAVFGRVDPGGRLELQQGGRPEWADQAVRWLRRAVEAVALGPGCHVGGDARGYPPQALAWVPAEEAYAVEPLGLEGRLAAAEGGGAARFRAHLRRHFPELADGAPGPAEVDPENPGARVLRGEVYLTLDDQGSVLVLAHPRLRLDGGCPAGLPVAGGAA